MKISKGINKLIRSHETTFARVVWCDLANIIRSKACHIDHLENYFSGIGLTPGGGGFCALGDNIVPETKLTPVGGNWLIPDLDSLMRLPYALHHLSAMGNILDSDNKPWVLCARSCLKKMMHYLNQIGIELQVGFENEFYLLKEVNENEYKPIENNKYSSDFAMNVGYEVLEDLIKNLIEQKIKIFCCHAESGNGQYEISFDPANPLQAADNQIIFRKTLQAVASKHLLTASILPKIFKDQAGNGAHVHLSLLKNSKNITFDKQKNYAISEVAASFIAGIMHHLPAIMAFTTPLKNSYERLKPHCWVGIYDVWGFDNREAAIRFPSSNIGYPTNIEIKTLDNTANPYLALSAIIAAGIDGIEQKLIMPKPVNIDPENLSKQEKKQCVRLPGQLSDALNALDKDKRLQYFLSPNLCEIYLAIKRHEMKYTKNLSHEEEINLFITRF